jgi:phosphate transport system protein
MTMVQFQRELNRLRKQLLELGGEVEDNVRDAMKALQRRDAVLAAEVTTRERETDEREVDIEEECLKLLALYQPVAADLRYIIGVLKINEDLERVGDLSRHIAERTSLIVELPESAVPVDLASMASKVTYMLGRSLEAFVNLKPEMAQDVRAADDKIDEMNRRNCSALLAAIKARPEAADVLLNVMHISRHLERIADHATNIAEDLIYMAQGEIVRHKPV